MRKKIKTGNQEKHAKTIKIYLNRKRPHTHTRLTALSPGPPRWAGTRKAKPIWILLKQETVSGRGISWKICKSAPRSRQITMPAPHCSVKSKTTTYNKRLATKIVADWELKVLNPAIPLAARSIHQIARPYDTRLANVAYVQGFKF